MQFPNRKLLKISTKFYLTHAAGVVFCHHKLPILQIRTYARQLCDLAKKAVPNEAVNIDSASNCFAFLNMTAFDLIKGNLEHFLEEYHSPAKPDQFILKADGLPTLLSHLQKLKNAIPQNKLYDLCRFIKSSGSAVHLWQRLLELYPNHKDKLECAQKVLGADSNGSQWLVIADLLDYVKESP